MVFYQEIGIRCVFLVPEKLYKTKIPEADDLPINVRPKSSHQHDLP